MLRNLGVGVRRGCGASTIAVVVAALLVAGCGGSSTVTRTGAGAKASFYTGGTPGGTPAQGGRAVIDMAEAPVTLDPVAVGTTITAEASLQISEGLLETVPNSKTVHGDLATSWTISPDGLTYTFHIREGVKFSNGEPLTAEDVIYSIERQRLPIAGYGAFIAPEIEKISATGPMTVQIKLKHVTSHFLIDLALAQTGIVPKKVLQHESEKMFALHPVGTGAYVLKSASPGFTNIVMVRNPHYWRSGQPHLDELVWNEVVEANARILAVQSGTATIDLNVPFSQAASLQKSSSGRVLIEPILSESLADFNNLAAPFTNVNVRKALNYATPREAIIKSVFKGLGTPANNVTNDLFRYYDSSVPTFPYDIAKAKQLLKESPVPHGFKMSMMIYSGDPNSSLIASILQSSWAQIGVHLNIRALPPTSFQAEELKRAYDMFLWTPEFLVSEQYEPDITYEEFAGPKAAPFFKVNSPRGTKLIEEATSTLDTAQRAKLWPEIQRLTIWEEAQFLPIAFVPQINLVSNALRGYVYPPNCYFHMREAWLAK